MWHRPDANVIYADDTPSGTGEFTAASIDEKSSFTI
jgi:hypothetical protein